MFALRSTRSELKELYIFTVLFSFAYSLIVVFEPVFLYKEGFSLSFIALYYALHYSLYIVLLPLGGMFASRFGVERSMSLSMPIFVLYFVTLAAVPEYHNLIYLAVVLLTVHKIFYWPSYHADFAKFGDAKNRGTELSWMSGLRYGVGILGPLTGGFVAAWFGFPALFGITALFVLAAAFPLLRTKEKYRVRLTKYSDPWKMLKLRKHRNMVVSMIGWGENLIDLVFWPVFMFIILGSTEKLGIIASATVAVMTVYSFFMGEMSDRFPRRSIVRLVVPFMMVSHLLRPLAGTPARVFFTDVLSRMSFAGVNIPTVFRLYVHAKRNSTITYMVAVEMALAVAKAVVSFILVAVFATLLPYTGFWVAFVMAALLAFFYGFL